MRPHHQEPTGGNVAAGGTRFADQPAIVTVTIRFVEAQQPSSQDHPPVVFLADDDRATLELLSEVARDAGWRPRGFTRLAELREAIEAAPPSLLILDDDLPDGRGGDLARELRNHPRLAAVPILVCTAAHPMRQAQIGNWAPVVAKPFDLGAVERFLDDARPVRPGSAAYHERAG